MRAAAPAQAAAQAATGESVNWPMHNLDLRNSRFAALDDINTANASRLVLKWSFDLPREQTIGQVTPLVVDGLMYFNSGSRLFALDAATGKQVWIARVEPEFPGTGRGPVYGGGRIYAYGLNVVYAVNAKTGALDTGFGNQGRLLVADAALRFKYPEKDALGYQVASPPAYLDGTLYFGLAQSEGHIPGGLVVAVNSATGAVKWVFNTVPQSPGRRGLGDRQRHLAGRRARRWRHVDRAGHRHRARDCSMSTPAIRRPITTARRAKASISSPTRLWRSG